MARNWFAGHGRCMLNDVKGALIALKEVLLTMTALPACPSPVAADLRLASAAVDQLSQRVNVQGPACLPPCSVAFALALRAFERVEWAASTAAGRHIDGFDKVVIELKSCAAAKAAAAALAPKEAASFTACVDAHAKVVSDVRNRVFHSTHDVTASMMDAVHSAAEVLRMLGHSPESQQLQTSRHDFLMAFRDTCLASPLPAQVANAVCDIARNCPFFSGAFAPEYAPDGSSAVSAPVMSHVLKGSLKAPGISPCDCWSKIAKTDIGAISKALSPLCEAMTRVPRFYSLDACTLRSAVAADLTACGQAIVAALPAGHQCGHVLFTDDADGHVRAVQHIAVCRLKHGSYDAACACASAIGSIMRDDCGSTANKDTKKCIKDWHAASSARVPLLTANADVTETDAFAHVLECDVVSRAVAPAAPAPSLHVTVKHGDQEGVQAFVDGFSGECLVDRDRQIAAAVAALQPVASGTCGPGGMRAALICGPPGTGKSHCGDDVLFKLSKLQAQRLCMEKVTCRSAAAVTSGLVMLGRRMGKTLGVGPDSSAADVLSSLKKHLAATPCALCQRVDEARPDAAMQVRDHAGRCLQGGSGGGAQAASCQRPRQRFADHVLLDQNGRRFAKHAGAQSGRSSRACDGAGMQYFE